LHELTAQTKGYPVAVGPTLYAVRGDKLLPLADETALFAYAAAAFDTGRSGVKWAGGEGMKTKAEFYQYAAQNATRYDATSAYPHVPPIPCVLYSPYAMTGGDGSTFAKLIGYFNPATELDGLLLAAAFATPLWGGAPGKRPAFLFEAAAGAPNGGRGSGKSTAAKVIAQLYGGSFSLNTNEDWGDFKKKLLNDTSEAGKRIVWLDNLKTAKLSWADLEAFVTDARINGHQLYKGSRDIPNWFTTYITMNNGVFAVDMALRCAPVAFKTPTYSAEWEPAVAKFVEDNRAAILGDIAAFLRDAPPVEPSRVTRFPEWCREVLSRLAGDRTDDVIARIRKWQDGVDGDEEAADHIRTATRRLLESLSHHINGQTPDEAYVVFTPRAVCELMNLATNDRLSVAAASSRLKAACVGEFEYKHLSYVRRWRWRGNDTAHKSPTHTIDFDPRPAIGGGQTDKPPCRWRVRPVTVVTEE
jgi:hypothetical protein